MQNDDADGFRLVACGRDGAPVEEITLPVAIADMCAATPDLWEALGYVTPWIGYVALMGDVAVGVGAFVGPPKEGRVEIAYCTIPEQEGKGYATQTARRLIAIARAACPAVEIFAKTMPEPNASTRILEKLGFTMIGMTTDHEIGDAWAWLMR